MQKSIISVICLIFAVIITPKATTIECFKQILHLSQTYAKNKTQFNQQMMPYLLFSGKTIDDLGLPSECRQRQGRSFNTVEIDFNTTEFYYETYFGFCFTDACSAEDLNSFGRVIIDDIFDGALNQSTILKFIAPEFQKSSSPGAIIIYVIFGLIIGLGFVHSGRKWLKQCKNKQQQEEQGEEEQINLSSRYNIMLDDDSKPRQVAQPFQVRFSLEKKFDQLQQKQQSNKVFQFSVFKLIAVPWLIIGQMFYLMNFASYNYFSFIDQVYETLFSSFAVAAYFLPDIFFFISAYLFTKKLVKYETNRQNIGPFISSALKGKIVRLYPLYIAVTLIYWLVSPTLHAGPVWYVYQQQTAICDTAWWRSIFLIDNWFTHGCYQPAWFVQVEMQLVLLNIVIMFAYFKKPMTTIGLLAILLTVSTILIFVISGPLPSSVPTMISHQTSDYFRSTYAHAPFYFIGMIFAITSHPQNSFNKFIKNKVVKRKLVARTLKTIGLLLCILIIWHPSVWEGVLGFELGICRLGFFICLLPYFLAGMYSEDLYETRVHKYAALTYPVLLCSGIVTVSAFWCYQTFPYVSGADIFRGMIPAFFISVAFGGILSLVLGLTKPIYK